ncbi:hypothetical protein B296_00029162 [Ensete ventricosum]|uniref:Uncharacterized protein n=1 Tax=Ensete ventricosum TaxID=4639 RepID=A0A427A0H3_ENSVE|nr:hypothetical protein B296_00029162 [Ensete ventricosum]
MLTGRWREEEVDLAGSMRDREQVHQAERKVTDSKVDRCAAREGERRRQRPVSPFGCSVVVGGRESPMASSSNAKHKRIAEEEEDEEETLEEV